MFTYIIEDGTLQTNDGKAKELVIFQYYSWIMTEFTGRHLVYHFPCKKSSTRLTSSFTPKRRCVNCGNRMPNIMYFAWKMAR
jgi:hypothetical protein